MAQPDDPALPVAVLKMLAVMCALGCNEMPECSIWFSSCAGGPKAHVNFSKLDSQGFIGGFERLAIACLHADAEKGGGLGRPKRTANPHCAAVGIDRAAPSNCRAGALPNLSPVLPSLGSAALDLAVALVAAMARNPDDDRPAGDGLALAPNRLVSDLGISITW